MNRKSRSLKSQSGVMLLEALIAILIFSLGILAIVGMQAIAAKQVTDAQYRSQASLLANQLFGQMWATDRTVATLQSTFDSNASGGMGTSASGYVAWKGKVTAALPVPADYSPRVSISPDGTAVVEIWWRAPNESVNAIPHKYTVVAKIL